MNLNDRREWLCELKEKLNEILDDKFELTKDDIREVMKDLMSDSYRNLLNVDELEDYIMHKKISDRTKEMYDYIFELEMKLLKPYEESDRPYFWRYEVKIFSEQILDQELNFYEKQMNWLERNSDKVKDAIVGISIDFLLALVICLLWNAAFSKSFPISWSQALVGLIIVDILQKRNNKL